MVAQGRCSTRVPWLRRRRAWAERRLKHGGLMGLTFMSFNIIIIIIIKPHLWWYITFLMVLYWEYQGEIMFFFLNGIHHPPSYRPSKSAVFFPWVSLFFSPRKWGNYRLITRYSMIFRISGEIQSKNCLTLRHCNIQKAQLPLVLEMSWWHFDLRWLLMATVSTSV